MTVIIDIVIHSYMGCSRTHTQTQTQTQTHVDARTVILHKGTSALYTDGERGGDGER